ncbi:MAG: ferrous iron transport protein A [Synechococcaceae cyanobacterium SM2_3_1]|nr:ferrous iron transport protein A [Synechococcaceae cyanobacterium SM2_3_1]
MLITQSFTVTFSPLYWMQPGEEGTLYRLKGCEDMLTQFLSLGLQLGMNIKVISQQPDLIISLQGRQIKVESQLAELISVRLEPSCPLPISLRGQPRLWKWHPFRFLRLFWQRF